MAKLKKTKKNKIPDILDVNANVAIAFALTMILAILMYAVFFKN